MADNRRIRNKVRGENGAHFDFGQEDALAATATQTQLDGLKAAGAIEGDWTSTKSAMTITGDGVSSEMAGRVAESGAEITTADGGSFKPLSIEETIAEMKKYNFSEQVTRSMTFHGDALKEALKGGSKTSTKTEDKGKEQSPDNDFPEGFPPYAKIALKKLGKTFADIKDLSREKLIELDGIAENSADAILAFIEQSKSEGK